MSQEEEYADYKDDNGFYEEEYKDLFDFLQESKINEPIFIDHDKEPEYDDSDEETPAEENDPILKSIPDTYDDGSIVEDRDYDDEELEEAINNFIDNFLDQEDD
jgi:hypothetical protein